MVGIIEKPEHITTQWFKDEGDVIILLGEPVDQADPILGLGGSAYLQVVHGQKTGTPPRCDLETEKTLHTTLLGLIQSGLVKSAHDCSEGGLAVTLAESCISQIVGRNTPRLIGAEVDLSYAIGRPALRRNAVARGHQLPSARRRESGRARQAHGRSRSPDRQGRRRHADGEDGERKIFRAAHRVARPVVEYHRAGHGVTGNVSHAAVR
jgi:hypothetical protein